MKILKLINNILLQQTNSQLLNKNLFVTPPQANVEIGKLKNDEIWGLLITPQSTQIQLINSNYTTKGKYTIYFLTDQGKLDFDAIENIEKQKRCLVVAKDFLYKLKLNNTIAISSEVIETTMMYSVNDRTCTGVKIDIDIQDKQSECLSEADSTVSVNLQVDNPTTSSLRVEIFPVSEVKTISKKGFVYGTTEVTLNNEIVLSENIYDLEGLLSDTRYYFKAFVEVNGVNTYSEIKSAKTKAEIVGYIKVFTSEASEIEESTAVLNGVVAYSNKTITEVGFCIATTINPTIDDRKIVGVLLNEEVATTADNLNSNTLYHYRTYAIANGVIVYGDDETFTTQLINPLLVTDNPTNITANSFTGNGLIFDYNRPLAEMGLVYGSNQYPVIGVGDAVKVVVDYDELIDYRYSKSITNIESDVDLYTRTFGTKQNGLTTYSLTSKKCYNAIPCDFYDWLLITSNLTIANCNLRYWQENYMYYEPFRSGICTTGIRYNNAYICQWNHQWQYIANTDTNIIYSSSSEYLGEVEMINNTLSVYNSNGTLLVSTPTGITASQFLETGKELTILRSNRGDSQIGKIINASKKTDEGFEDLYLYLVPCKLTNNIPGSKSFDGLSYVVGSVGMWDMASSKFLYAPNGYVGNN